MMKEFNRQYMIIQTGHREFKAYCKGWFLWNCYQTYSFSKRKEDKTFRSWNEAEEFLGNVRRWDKKDWEQKKFQKVERQYPPNKLPGE